MIGVLCFVAWVMSLSEENRSTGLSLLIFVIMLTSCGKGV